MAAPPEHPQCNPGRMGRRCREQALASVVQLLQDWRNYPETMSHFLRIPFLWCAALLPVLSGCGSGADEKAPGAPARVTTPAAQAVSLPAPFATESAKKFSKVTGWAAGQAPVAPAGFAVSRFADSLDNPR